MAVQPILSARAGVVLSPDLSADPDVFPRFRGQGFQKKGVRWSTTSVTSKSGRTFRTQNWTYPIWEFSLSFAGISMNRGKIELTRFFAFYSRKAGQFAPFYYYDPSDNSVDGEPLGTGDGVTAQFQLIRWLGGWYEPIFVLAGPPHIFADGVEVTNWSIVPPGIVVFQSAPAAGVALSWSGTFLFYCHFTQDQLDAQQLNSVLWSNDGLTFETIKL